MPGDYKAHPEQAILFTVTAWNANCSQHIPRRFDAADVIALLAERDGRIAALEAEAEAEVKPLERERLKLIADSDESGR